jgi:hypothetical protein
MQRPEFKPQYHQKRKVTPEWSAFNTILECGTPSLQFKIIRLWRELSGRVLAILEALGSIPSTVKIKINK